MATKGRKADTGSQTANQQAEERTPEEIQADIEATREDLGETVAAIADKADVKKQAKRKVEETKAKATAKKDEVKQKAATQKKATTAKVKEATPASAQEGAQQATQAAQEVAAQASQAARENPVQTRRDCRLRRGSFDRLDDRPTLTPQGAQIVNEHARFEHRAKREPHRPCPARLSARGDLRQADHRRGAETHAYGVQRGQPHGLGRSAYVLRPARPVPGSDRSGVATRPLCRSADDRAEDHRDRHPDRSLLGGTDLRRTDRVDHLQPVGGRHPVRGRTAGRALVGVWLRGRLHARFERHLRDAGGAPDLEAPAVADADHPRDRAPGRDPEPLVGPHWARSSTRSPNRSESTPPRSRSGTSPSGR